MAKVGAQRAAELTGKSKSTVQRAMNAGKLSFEVDANGRRLVDVSELERVFGLQPQGEAASAAPASINHAAAMDVELEKARHAIEIERLKMDVRLAQEQAEMAQQQVEDLKVQRDLWQKQAQQILITSQYTQKQSEERITEMREREEARQRAMEARKMQAAAVNHAPQAAPAKPQVKPQAKVQQAAQEARVVERASVERPVQQQAASQSQTPVFRTVQVGNQNRVVTPAGAQGPEKVSLFASLFGIKKTKRA